MSDLGLDLEPRRRRRPERPRAVGCVAVLISLAILLGGGYAVYSIGFSALEQRLRPPPDYSGPGTGKVLVEVRSGDIASDIASTLLDKQVVKSVEAFTAAARREPKAVRIQDGFYEMRQQMSAEDALEVLVDPANRLRNAVTVREGLRVDQVVDLLARRTDFTRRQFERVLAKPRLINLPSYAKGNPEGYLFPATYEVTPGATPRSILAGMVERYRAAAGELRLEARAERLGRGPHEVMTVASIVQAEGRRSEDLPKIARVLYNRLAAGQPLQLDTTIVYIFRTEGKLTTTDEQRASRSPYNTYRRAGLPPTPISAPGEAAIEAALDPAKGTWRYFVTTDPSTGETAFATSYAGHLQNVKKFRAYCRTNDC